MGKTTLNENYLKRFNNIDVVWTREVSDGILTCCYDVQIPRDGSTNITKIFDPVHRLAAIENVELDKGQQV